MKAVQDYCYKYLKKFIDNFLNGEIHYSWKNSVSEAKHDMNWDKCDIYKKYS